MDFRSDNVAGAAPEILAALTRANAGRTAAYGEDDLTRAVEARIAEIFEADGARVFLLATGTAANAISLAAVTPPWGAVLCHAQAHIEMDECGAPEFFTGGAKLIPLPDHIGKFSVADMETALARLAHGVHNVQPATVSLTQSAETGVVYTPDEIGRISAFARARGFKVHMDGARFANALAALGCAPAEATWKAGVDILCFGASKNGALAAEAIVCFDPALAETIAFRRKRAGHLFSKSRFIAAQFDAYLADDLWLRNARHANAMAERLAEGLGNLPGVRIVYPTEANEVFPEFPESVIQGLDEDGALFYRWGGAESPVLRLVTAFDTTPAQVDAFLEAARRHTADAA